MQQYDGPATRLSFDVAQAVVTQLAKEIEKYRPEDAVVAVDNLRHCFHDPKGIVRIASEMLKQCTARVGAPPTRLEMPIPGDGRGGCEHTGAPRGPGALAERYSSSLIGRPRPSAPSARARRYA